MRCTVLCCAAGRRANHIYRCAAGRHVSNILQRAGPTSAGDNGADAGRDRQATATEQSGVDPKVLAGIEEAQAFWAQHGPAYKRQAMLKENAASQLKSHLAARARERPKELQAAIIKRSMDYNKNHMIEIDDDSPSPTVFDMERRDGLPYDVLFPSMYAGKDVKPAVVSPSLPYLGDSVKVIKKGSCGCDDCCCDDSCGCCE